MAVLFRDRVEAGEVLAGRLGHYAGRPDVLVLALPRGGVPVAERVACALGAPLDVFVVRKLGMPGRPELAMGAIAAGGVRVLNREVVRRFHIPDDVIEQVAAGEGRELARREASYRQGRPPPALAGRVVILVDDGLATGSTMRAAVAAAHRLGPARVVVAVPTAPSSTCERLRAEAGEVVCVTTPRPFSAVGNSYRSFPQTSDEEVRTLLARAAQALGGTDPTRE
ncbi:MAG TPA: phosphoribosyltransferase [Actinomycetes bacterium]|jgi:predicted phosphoribosyltransferase|nr:phosphoribosyltransferase [Actinomycetes bacterium]